jgi:MFS transporter, NNP family, nitrate/nitrite transporter
VSGERESPYRLTGSPSQGLAGATLGFFIGFAAVALFGPTASRLKEAMDLDPVLVGFLVAAPSFSGSLLRIPFSAWVDTTGGRKPFLILLVLSLVGMTGLFLLIRFFYPNRMSASLYPLVAFLGVLCGCGIAAFSVGISQVAYWYPKGRHGTALGIYAGVGNLAPGLFSFLLPVALVSLSLAEAYLAWLLFLAAGTVLYAAIGRNAWYFQLLAQGAPREEAQKAAARRGQEIFPAASLRESLLRSARVWKTWALVGVYFTTFGGFIALTAWLPTYYTFFFEVDVVVAGTLTAVYSILTSVVRIPSGFLSDRYGGEVMATVALLTMLGGALFMTVSGHLGVSAGAAILMALGMGGANAAVFKLVAQEVPEAVGGAAGWVGGLGAFGGFAIPPVMGAFVQRMDRAGYARGFIVFAGLAALSLALIHLLRRERPAALSAGKGT